MNISFTREGKRKTNTQQTATLAAASATNKCPSCEGYVPLPDEYIKHYPFKKRASHRTARRQGFQDEVHETITLGSTQLYGQGGATYSSVSLRDNVRLATHASTIRGSVSRSRLRARPMLSNVHFPVGNCTGSWRPRDVLAYRLALWRDKEAQQTCRGGHCHPEGQLNALT